MEWDQVERLFWRLQIGLALIGGITVSFWLGVNTLAFYGLGTLLISAQFKLIALIVKGALGTPPAKGPQIMVWLGLKLACWGVWAIAMLWLPAAVVRPFALGCASFLFAVFLMPLLLQFQSKRG